MSNASRNHRNNPYLVEDMSVKFHRSAAGVAWRWRTEITILAVLGYALARLSGPLGLSWALAVLGGSLALLLALPWSRRVIMHRIWCLLARHRIHRLCYEARLHTRAGRLPLVVWIRPTKVGERAHVLCRAGICAEDFEAHTGELRAGCFARDARVTRNPRWSQLVRIDIIRRDTLAATRQVASPLTVHARPELSGAGRGREPIPLAREASHQ